MSRFAAIQMQPALLDPEANLAKVEALIDQAAGLGVTVAVFPECALTGYGLTADEASAMAEAVPGPRTERLAQACHRARLLAVVGTLEKDPDGPCFNTAVLVGPAGVLGAYRKTHLPFLGVDRFLAAGDEITPPVATPAGRLGMLICYDLRFPEPARILALAGAQVILLPTAWPASAKLYPEFMAQSRAAENSVYLVAANRIGEERGARYLGRSIIAGPDGEKLAEGSSDGEAILVAEIDPARSDRKERIFVPGEYELDLFNDRRPDLYGGLATSGGNPRRVS